MEKQSVYKLDSKGKQRVWSIWVEGNPTSLTDPAMIKIQSGLLDGKKIDESVVVTSGKNLGKANATTPYTQAVSEAEAKLELKLRGEYRRSLEEVSQGTLRSGIQSPMLAQKYHPTGEQKGSKTLDKMKIRGQKIHVQPKLDGNRCLIKLFSEKVADGIGVVNYELRGTMYTRKGDVMPVQLDHIIDELNLWYGEISTFEDSIILDGELFSTELSFNELNGHLKRKDSQDPDALKKIKFHLYDVMLGAPYDERYAYIKSFGEFGDYVEVIPSHEIVATDEAIKEKLEEFLGEGHEGLMIRTLNSGYENKRSWQLVKVKLFEDEEFEVVDLETDAMGRLGKFIMKLPEPVTDRDGKVVTTFKAGIKGIDHAEGRKMLANKQDYIGKMATIEYFGMDIRPRFPKFKALRTE